MQPFVAVTDRRWFDYLRSRSTDGRVDEVNFWSPRATTPLKRFVPGEPVFFRLKAPVNRIVGYGFYAHHATFSLDEAWRLFGWRNGCRYEEEFRQRIGGFRGVDLHRAGAVPAPLGATILRDARFWPEGDWMPWGAAQGWARNVVRGATVGDPARVAALLAAIRDDEVRREVDAELSSAYRVVEDDDRTRRAAESVVREGQGTFRARLLDAYGRQCAITGEHTEPVLDAAHIQPYLGPRSNHPQNGLLLTKEFHALFDLGLVTVTEDYRVRVSKDLRTRWRNGRRYYPYDGQPLVHVPSDPSARPSREALAWHRARCFVG